MSEIGEATNFQNKEVTHGESTSELIESLVPETYTNQEGNQQTIFTFKNKQGRDIRAVFYQPDEIPFNREILEGREGFIYGSKPKWREGEDWEKFIDDVKDASSSHIYPLDSSIVLRSGAVTNETSLFFVETSPQHLLDFAFTLGVEDEKLRITRREASRKVLTEDANQIIDRIIAANTANTSESKIPEKNYTGEVLTILALMGDTSAASQLSEYKNQLDEKSEETKKRKMSEIGERVNPSEDPFRLEDFVAVHLTRYLPRKDEKGGREMVSTFDATEWKMPRDTIHFALNHPVASHMYGSWEAAPYAIITPLNKLMEVNGDPSVINTVDTFFEISPGTTLKLPEGTVIVKPSPLPEGKLFVQEGQEVRYSSDVLNNAGVTALVDMLHERGLYEVNAQLASDILDLFVPYGSDERFRLSDEDYNKISKIFQFGDIKEDILSSLAISDPAEVVGQLLKKYGEGINIPEGAVAMILASMQGSLVAKVKEQATRETIRTMGYKDTSGGMWAWGDSWDVTAKTAELGVKLNIPISAHSGHITHHIEEFLYRNMNDVGQNKLNSRERMKNYDYPSDTLEEFMSDNSPQTRRMLYLLGAI